MSKVSRRADVLTGDRWKENIAASGMVEKSGAPDRFNADPSILDVAPTIWSLLGVAARAEADVPCQHRWATSQRRENQ